VQCSLLTIGSLLMGSSRAAHHLGIVDHVIMDHWLIV